MGRPRQYTRPPILAFDGVSFPPVMVDDGRDPNTGQRRLIHAHLAGEPLYSLPGGLMAYRRDLPAIAARLKSSGKSTPRP